MTALTRRGALIAVAAAPLALRVAPAVAEGGDGAVLTRVQRLEVLAAAAYAAAANQGPPSIRATAARFAQHEADHVAAVAAELEALGARRVPLIVDPGALERAASANGITPAYRDLRSERDHLRFLLAVEEALLAAWVEATATLHDFGLVQTAASILGCQGQHLVDLRRALGRDPVPRALAG
jgi:hypothetical protein